ncbi:MAG: hypothetical protein FWF60_07130, partial [Oscillospiraceae bacterium]|nr:hypothetical protein [Oscillospiraceae bacterium]
MPDDPAAVTPSKPKPSAALVFGALAGLAFLCLLAGAVLSAVSGIASYSTPAWQYWPWAVGIQRVLFVLLPMACFALSLFGAKRRRTVFLLLALAWQASILLYDIWYLWPPDLAYYLKSLLPLALSAACLLVLF